MKNNRHTTQICYDVRICSLGMIMLAWSELGLCGLTLSDNTDVLRNDLLAKFPEAHFQADLGTFEADIAGVLQFIEHPAPDFRVRLDPHGTPFQQKVWQALAEIPLGSTASYSEIADKIGAPKAVRAVANACANNPLAIVIPCHRVVGRNGKLCGYRWGIARKAELLRREALIKID